MEIELLERVRQELFHDSVRMAQLLGMSQTLYWQHVNSEADIELTPLQIVTLLEETAKTQGSAVAEMRNVLSRAKIEGMAAPSTPSPGLLGSARLYKRILLMAREVGISPVGVERVVVAVLKTALEEKMSIEDVIALCLDNPKP